MQDLPLRCPAPPHAGHEWMVTNGLGGYGSGCVISTVSRRHDGVLVAALPYPRGRSVMVDWLQETLHHPTGQTTLQDCPCRFHLDGGLPVWEYQTPHGAVRRRIVMPWRQNSTHVLYDVPVGCRLVIRPWLHCRHADWGVDQPVGPLRGWLEAEGCCLQMGDWPVIRLSLTGAAWQLGEVQEQNQHYPVETERDFLDHGPVQSMAEICLAAPKGTLRLSCEQWQTAAALDGEQAWEAERLRRQRLLRRAAPALTDDPLAAHLVLAADGFVFEPQNRPAFAAQAAAEGDGVRSIIAGYPWFNDWGRDTMISLEGLTLLTGRHDDATTILRTFARCLKDGLIPDNIPDGPWPPVYHTVDATLWFFHAIGQHQAHGGDPRLLADLRPLLRQSLQNHLDGTLFGIACDPQDGLLQASAPGYQLTWMDAIVGDWVVTPRRGKPVEINALWYNALCLMAQWQQQAGQDADADMWANHARRARQSFQRRFWYEGGGYLYDVIDGDPAESVHLRPNQIFALSLPHPVLEARHWEQVFRAVEQHLRTPRGLRSLSPDSPAYRPRFAGNQLSRDGAYHQGTVWPWLAGAYVDAWMRVAPQEQQQAQDWLRQVAGGLDQYCLGWLGEVFDADPPHAPRGCTAQAWSVAEWLRAWKRVRDTKQAFP